MTLDDLTMDMVFYKHLPFSDWRKNLGIIIPFVLPSNFCAELLFLRVILKMCVIFHGTKS